MNALTPSAYASSSFVKSTDSLAMRGGVGPGSHSRDSLEYPMKVKWAQAHASCELRQSALDSGILTTAEGNARATLTTMLHSLGFQQITFR